MDFLTVEEAKVLTQKSESTLRRLIKKALSSKKKSKWIKKKKRSNGGYQYLIHPELLNIQESTKKVKKKDPIDDDPIKAKVVERTESKEVDVLKKYIDSLERQLGVKDKQIFELLERDRENHQLLEKINEALIKFRVPEYIETQIISEDKSELILSKNEPNETASENVETKSTKPEQSFEKGTFSDWLESL